MWHYPGISSLARTSEEGNFLDLHPTVKPVAMIAGAIMDAWNRGDIVLDPFLGSGTTVIAAERTGRIARAIELDPLYVDVAARRSERLTQRSAVHVTERRTFDDVQAGNSANCDDSAVDCRPDALGPFSAAPDR